MSDIFAQMQKCVSEMSAEQRRKQSLKLEVMDPWAGVQISRHEADAFDAFAEYLFAPTTPLGRSAR